MGVTQDIGRGDGESVVHSFRHCHMRLASPSLPFSMPSLKFITGIPVGIERRSVPLH